MESQVRKVILPLDLPFKSIHNTGIGMEKLHKKELNAAKMRGAQHVDDTTTEIKNKVRTKVEKEAMPYWVEHFTRSLSRKFPNLSPDDIKELANSKARSRVKALRAAITLSDGGYRAIVNEKLRQITKPSSSLRRLHETMKEDGD